MEGWLWQRRKSRSGGHEWVRCWFELADGRWCLYDAPRHGIRGRLLDTIAVQRGRTRGERLAPEEIRAVQGRTIGPGAVYFRVENGSYGRVSTCFAAESGGGGGALVCGLSLGRRPPRPKRAGAGAGTGTASAPAASKNARGGYGSALAGAGNPSGPSSKAGRGGDRRGRDGHAVAGSPDRRARGRAGDRPCGPAGAAGAAPGGPRFERPRVAGQLPLRLGAASDGKCRENCIVSTSVL